MLRVDQAKKKIEELQHFVNLAESYKRETIEQRVIRLLQLPSLVKQP